MLNLWMRISLATIFSFILVGCKKFVDIPAPTTNINTQNVFQSDATAAAVLTGIYTKLSRPGIGQAGDPTSLSFFAGMSADEFTLTPLSTNVQYADYITNQLNIINGSGTEYWSRLYAYIYDCNSAIEGLSQSTTLTPIIKSQLLGEAKFLRAFFYFYLTNLYGDVPLTTSSNYSVNSKLPRTAQSEVYEQIIKDLIEAKTLLAEHYVSGDAFTQSSERVRPNKWAASALLSRVYLYSKDFNKAEIEATSVINSASNYSLVPITDVFLKNNNEAIWQLQPVNADWNSEEGKLFILPPTGPDEFFPVYLNNNLVIAFEPGDQRKSYWTAVFYEANGDSLLYPFKYKSALQGAPVTEYSTVLRLAELYLIRAEARIEQNNISGGIDDLNILRLRATELNNSNPQLPQLSSGLSKENALTALYHERRVELFSEWGHRWFDLKRTGQANVVLSDAKGSTWQNTDQLYPIPQGDIDNNPAMKGKQNPGY